MNTRALTLIIIFLILPLSATADLYSWVDKSGNQYFSDSLSKIPEEYRNQARKTTQSGEQMNYESRSKDTYTPANNSEQRDHDGHNEAWWRAQVKSIRSQITAEEDNVAYYHERQISCEAEQKQILGYRKNCSSMYQESIKRSEWKVEQLRQKLEVELPEQARKAGALPGWLRE